MGGLRVLRCARSQGCLGIASNLDPGKKGPCPGPHDLKRTHSVPPLASGPAKAHVPPPDAGPPNSPPHSLHRSFFPLAQQLVCTPGLRGGGGQILPLPWMTHGWGVGMGFPRAAAFQQWDPRCPRILNAIWPSRWF